uniref:Zinc finger MYM-type containing 4 n=1 Tax=Fundulus heteroclitus TaxID=8078 RepID=A0A3Q2PKT4_FUNHE
MAKVKDEPVDEEYEQALISSTSTASVKDEPVKVGPTDDLKIGSVYSVTPSGETLPCVNPSTVHMSCSNCRKNLQKGQTAFQRKGSPALFCSTACLTTALPSAKGSNKLCHYCQKMILRPQDVILAPDPNGTMKEFCSQICMNAFSFKKQPLSIHPAAVPAKSPQTQSLCSMCSRFSTVSPSEKPFAASLHPGLDIIFQNRSALAGRESTRQPAAEAECYSVKLLVQISSIGPVCLQDKIIFLCSSDCSMEYKKANAVMSLCEYCKIEKITREAKRINNKDCFFCSDGCKLLFRHELSKNWGKHCHSCVYCHCVSKKLVTAQYGGSVEEFCSEDCRSKYTMLFCHVAKCDSCGRKGKLKQSLPLLGEVKHFCGISCLLKFCCDKVATQGEVLKGPSQIFTFPEPKNTKFGSSDSGVFVQMSVQTDAPKSHPPPPAAAAAPPAAPPKLLKNKALLCKPLVQNKGVSCKTQTVSVEAQTDDMLPRVMVVPVPVPVYVPVPMNMYSQFAPKPLSLPLPLPVPMFLPVTMNSAERIVETIQEIKQKIPSDPYEAELILMAEMVAEGDDEQNGNKPESRKEKATERQSESKEVPFQPTRPHGSLLRFQGRKSQRAKAAEESPPRTTSKKSVSAEILKLKSQYGVDAWKRWIQWRQTQPNLEQRRFGCKLLPDYTMLHCNCDHNPRPLELKEDLLSCTTAELSYGLCCFITEVKRPGGEPYSPDSLFYLCLGIQQYLFENGRVENIFMDRFYGKFSSDFTNMLKGFEPTITRRGYVHSRVEEEFLWGCKQLGAYSPIVLLNTLLFFCCKYFGFTTVEQHRQLSFAHVMRCTKTNPDNTKTTFLRFYPPIPVNEAESDEVKRKLQEFDRRVEILEMMENTDNPLRCPVRLYEFYLSKCSESVKQRTNMFYLHPERCCVPNSPLWFSSTPLDDSTMESMLIRILTVRELHLRTKKERQVVSDPPFIPEEEDEDSD